MSIVASTSNNKLQLWKQIHSDIKKILLEVIAVVGNRLPYEDAE